MIDRSDVGDATDPDVPAGAAVTDVDPPPVDGTGLDRTDVDSTDFEHELVLPWWQHPLNILTLLVSVALVAAMIGWLVGDSRAQPSGSDVDIGFLQDMREHHEQGVAMGFVFLALDDTHPGLRTEARSIVFGQGIEIGRMIQLLRDRDADESNQGDTSMTWMGMSAAVGSMPGIASDADLQALGDSSGDEADQRFVELMVAHHLGGVEMAQFAMANASDDEVRAMATSIVDGQLGEIITLQRLLD